MILNKLMKLSDLAIHLEYDDLRSVVKWCKKQNILILYEGKGKFVSSEMVALVFENQFKKFSERHYKNPDQIMDAYHADDKATMSEAMQAPITSKVKKQFREKKERSKTAMDFLNQLKQA